LAPVLLTGVFYFQQGLDLGPLVNIVWQKPSAVSEFGECCLAKPGITFAKQYRGWDDRYDLLTSFNKVLTKQFEI
jgi:hypothetical protein